MEALTRFYRYLNILSLDVVIGSVINALFFASLLEVHIRPYGLAALALTVWIIYTADHLRDAMLIKQPASSFRHAFHQQNRKVLTALVVVAVTADLVLLLFVRPMVIVGGVGLMFCVIVYLLVQRRFHFLKEVFVAMLYTLGILLPSIAVTQLTFSAVHVLMIVLFFLISLLNLYLFSYFGVVHDNEDDLGSFVLRFGTRVTRWLIVIIFAVTFVLVIVVCVIQHFHPTTLVPLLMTAVLLMIFGFQKFFGVLERYRLAGDAIFYVPVIYLIWIS